MQVPDILRRDLVALQSLAGAMDDARSHSPALRASEAAVLRVELECFPDVSFEKLDLENLTFYLNGESAVVHSLYELLCRNCVRILVRDPVNPKTPVRELPVRNLRAHGIRRERRCLAVSPAVVYGIPAAAGVFRVSGEVLFSEPERPFGVPGAGLTSKAELLFLISPFEQDGRHQRLEVAVNDKTLRLGSTPIINLFAQAAEPILVDQTRYQYPIVPDARRRQTMEIYSVDEVVSTDAETHETVVYHPLYSERHVVQGITPAYWYITRSESTRKGDEGTDVFLSLVDLSARPMELDYDTVTVRCTCTNRDLVARLPFGSENGDFEMTGAAAIKKIVALHKPTRTLRPPLDGKTLWSLISHLSLNYLSIVDDGKEALQKILELYDFSDSPESKKQIGGITAVMPGVTSPG